MIRYYFRMGGECDVYNHFPHQAAVQGTEYWLRILPDGSVSKSTSIGDLSQTE